MRPTSVLRFLGANRTVTGSKLLVERAGARVLVDCGLYQGPRELRQRNREPLPIDLDALDGVVITHAHLDHVGHLPLLVRDGFRGPVFATSDTVALAGIVLPDSGRLHEEEARYARRHGYSRHDPPLPLYTEEDAQRALTSFRPTQFDAAVEVAPGLSVTFHPAGHILGSASIELAFDDGLTIVCSGDLGRPVHPLLQPPCPLPECDVLVIESTYGDRVHPTTDDVFGRLADTVREVAERGGRIVIPAFAVDRTEVVLHALQELQRAAKIPTLPVYVDSPMALAALRVYERALDRGAIDLRPELHRGADLFPDLDLRTAQTVEESKAIDESAYPAIVVSASGMAAGGRVLHHLAGMLGDPRSAVVLAGFQAYGTRGRALLDGDRTIKLLGRYVNVRAQVVDITGLSQHADRDELLAWVDGAATPPDTAFVVHGEPDASTSLAADLGRRDITAVVPEYEERVMVVGQPA